MISVVVIGANGQLGQCFQKIAKNNHDIDWVFKTSKELDITDQCGIQGFFKQKQYDYIINCAAYTNVENAEKEPKKAFLVNAEGPKNLATSCKENDITLIHVSTDYVFDGEKASPYTEEDPSNPINEYGKSKLAGEQFIQEIFDKHFIVRTSWLYSEFGHNFFKTILKKSETEKELTITTSETGTPTNANDLAGFIVDIVLSNTKKYGIYHYSNQGEATWYDFAEEILRVSGKLESIVLKKTDNYPTFASRPVFSVLSKAKAIETFDLDVFNWKKSLEKLMKKN